MGSKPRLLNKSKTATRVGWIERAENTIDKMLDASGAVDNMDDLMAHLVCPDRDDVDGPGAEGTPREVKVTVTITIEEIAP